MSETNSTLALGARGLRKNYGHVQALDGADFELREGEIHALVGDNGAGKSTLIKVISGAVTPDAGDLRLFGQPVTFNSPRDAQAAGVETVYQDLALADTLDAAENVFLGRELLLPGPLARLGFVDRRAMRARAREQLAILNISLPSVTVPVATLSGGQRQAVAVARAGSWGRRLLIMDEPVAALAPKQAQLVLDLMRRVRDERGLSVIFISHTLPHVFRAADRVTVMRLGRCVLTRPVASATNEMLIAAMTGVSEAEVAHESEAER